MIKGQKRQRWKGPLHSFYLDRFVLRYLARQSGVIIQTEKEEEKLLHESDNSLSEIILYLIHNLKIQTLDCLKTEGSEESKEHVDNVPVFAALGKSFRCNKIQFWLIILQRKLRLISGQFSTDRLWKEVYST